jgi:hypothetical protein
MPDDMGASLLERLARLGRSYAASEHPLFRIFVQRYKIMLDMNFRESTFPEDG